MVVVVIIGLLATLGIGRFINQGTTAKITAAKAQIQEISQALDLFHLDNGFYPTTDQGLEALLKEPTMPPEPINYRKGGYVKKLPNDPWGRPFLYRCPGDHGDFDLYSFGPDGVEGGEGDNKDITSW